MRDDRAINRGNSTFNTENRTDNKDKGLVTWIWVERRGTDDDGKDGNKVIRTVTKMIRTVTW